MAILKKPEPKKRECGRPAGGTATGLSAILTAARTLAPSFEESEMRRDRSQIQLDIMKADLRLHIAQADLAETTAARAKADFKEALTARKVRLARGM